MSKQPARYPDRFTVKSQIDLGRITDIIIPQSPGEFRVSVRRPDDLLVFDLVFENLQLVSGNPAHLVKKDPNAPAYFIVDFPPQSFGEEAFLEESENDVSFPKESDGTTEEVIEVSNKDNYPKKNVNLQGDEEMPSHFPLAYVRMAGRSRVAFSMPATETTLQYTLLDILKAFRTWPMQLDINALPEPDPLPHGLEGNVLKLGRDWLKSITKSQSWTNMHTSLNSMLEARGGKEARETIEASAQRLYKYATANLAIGAKQEMSQVLHVTMQGELRWLESQLQQLSGSDGRDLIMAALSLTTTEKLAASNKKFVLGINDVRAIPFVPVNFAPHEPPLDVTALELPYRLILSPVSPARWLHQDGPVTHNDRTELWHTRLTTSKEDFGPDNASNVRAIWSEDYRLDEEDLFSFLTPPPSPFRMSLDCLDRKMLVKLMSGFNEKTGGKPYKPLSSRAERLHLTALGALLDVEGNWSAQRPDEIDLQQWRHLSTLGRDHYVRVVYAGYLCPFGHAASLIKVTERKFESITDGGAGAKKRVAVLRQRFFLIVRERVRKYNGDAVGHVSHGNNFPFTEVEILTHVTPKLLEPGVGVSALKKDGAVIYDAKVVPRMVFWPMIPGTDPEPAQFQIVATDLIGNRVTFAMPLLFVSETANKIDEKIKQIMAAYNGEKESRRQADLGGATVCFAPFDPTDESSDVKGDPRLPTERMTYAAGNLKKPSDDAPNFYPETDSARVGIRPVQRLFGQPNAISQVTYPPVYKENGLGEGNKGMLFLILINKMHKLEFGGESNQAKSDTVGALASPQMTILGLSKTIGPVSGEIPDDVTDSAKVQSKLDNIINDKFTPNDFFKDATILGGISLSEILEEVNSLTSPAVPKMLSRESSDKQILYTTFNWETEIKNGDLLSLFIPKADGDHPTMFKMDSNITTALKEPNESYYEATAHLENFKINLFGFIIIWFEDLKFSAKKGQKPDVTVNLRSGEDAVQFGGPLEFVNTLRRYIPSNGFSDPPGLAITPSGLNASYSLDLPVINVGIFSLSGASLGAAFCLPFDSNPASVRFNFSERQHPFSLTVSLLGGGGFFAIGVSTRGVQEIEAALEFGAAVAIDLGVASGGVEIKAGVYFHWLETVPNKGSVDFAGYIRLQGELSILGIISASLTFNLQLAYHKEEGGSSIVWGEATLIVEIEVLFFSADVSVHCRREFAGSDPDPKFIDLIPDETTWNEYCDAFADEVPA